MPRQARDGTTRTANTLSHAARRTIVSPVWLAAKQPQKVGAARFEPPTSRDAALSRRPEPRLLQGRCPSVFVLRSLDVGRAESR